MALNTSCRHDPRSKLTTLETDVACPCPPLPLSAIRCKFSYMGIMLEHQITTLSVLTVCRVPVCAIPCTFQYIGLMLASK